MLHLRMSVSAWTHWVVTHQLVQDMAPRAKWLTISSSHADVSPLDITKIYCLSGDNILFLCFRKSVFLLSTSTPHLQKFSCLHLRVNGIEVLGSCWFSDINIWLLSASVLLFCALHKRCQYWADRKRACILYLGHVKVLKHLCTDPQCELPSDA